MRIRFLLLAFALFQAACASIPALPPCEAAGCFATAKPARWPTDVLVSGVALRFHELTITVPADSSAIAVQSDVLFLKYVDNSVITISRINAGSVPSPVPLGLTAIEWAEVLFTKTPADKKRDDFLAAGVWEEIILSKTVIIGGGEVVVYRKGSLIAYRVFGEDMQPYKDDLVFIDARKPREFYRIGVNELPRTIVDKILASVKFK